MAFFPTSPVDGEQANVGNITYEYNSSLGVWNRVGTTVTQLVDGTVVTITGNLIASGTGTNQFANDVEILGTLDVTGAFTSATVSTGNISGANLALTGGMTSPSTVSANSVTVSGTVTSTGDISSLSQITAPTIVSSGNIQASANFVGGGNVSVPGSVNAANAVLTGDVSAQNFVAAANITATGNISGSYILGNGSLLTGVVTGGGGAGNRANVTVNTGVIANAVSFSGNVTLAKGYVIYKISTTDAAWVRLYSSTATQSADSGRDQDTDPQPGAGVMVEAITNAAQTVVISPAAVGWNDESPVSNVIPISVTNLSGSSVDIGITLTYLGIEL